jgi:hypothetical protein
MTKMDMHDEMYKKDMKEWKSDAKELGIQLQRYIGMRAKGMSKNDIADKLKKN